MRNDDHTQPRFLLHLRHGVGHDFQSVDVQSAVNLIQHRQRRLQHFHLHDFVALFLAARKALIEETMC